METSKITHILVVDDDQRLRLLLQRYLKQQGFLVTAVAETKSMDTQLSRHNFQLIVLDLMLPGEGGLDACKRLRSENNKIPIIILTAKGEELDRIIGLELGADDYLPKPFNPRELVARINAIMRRYKITAADISPNELAKIHFGDFEFDLEARSLWQGGRELKFTSGLFDLLKILSTRPNVTLSRTQMLTMLNAREYDGTDRGIDIQISRLRKMIEVDPKNPRFV